MPHVAPEFEVSNDEQDPFIVQEVIKMPAPTDLVGSGTILGFGAIVELIPEGRATIVFNIYGSWNQTNVFEATVDGTLWFPIDAWQVSTKQYVSSFTTNDQFYVFCAALKKVRIRNTVLTSGTCTITYDASSATLYNKLSLDNYGRQITRIAGIDPSNIADVVLQSGVQRLATTATVTVEQIFGFDDFADTWFQILTAGANTNTWRVQIAAGYLDTQTPFNNPPAVDVTITVTATEAGDEIKMRDKIISALNADANFSPHWKTSAIKDNPIVHISSKYIGEFGERSTIGQFIVTPTGTASFTYQNSDNQKIVRRGKQNSGSRDSRDKRLVTVGVSGEVTSTPGAIGDLFIKNAMNAGSADMRVNGTLGTPIVFSITADATKDIFIEELRFYGNGNGIKFGQFLSQNNPLTNGILIEIRSDETVTQLPVIFTTDDLKHKFGFGQGSGFQLHVQAGRDDFMSSYDFNATFPIRKAGTYLVDDYVKIFIRDNLTAGLLALEFLGHGFRKEV